MDYIYRGYDVQGDPGSGYVVTKKDDASVQGTFPDMPSAYRWIDKEKKRQKEEKK